MLGSQRDRPSGSIAALRRAAGFEARGIELDVRPASDGVQVVIGDLTVDRATDGAGRAAALGVCETERD